MKKFKGDEFVAGTRFGRWVSTGRIDRRANRSTHVECVCDCGTKKFVYGSSLIRGLSTSCGCYRDERAGTYSVTHGYTKSKARPKTYRVWEAMHERCSNPNNKRYSKYGARGISVCERWASFENFLADMGEKPDGMTIDRIDNDLGYEPGNCRWATATEQARNKSNNHYVPVGMYGVFPLVEACEMLGLKYGTVASRILKSKWSVEKSLAS